MYVTSMAERKR